MNSRDSEFVKGLFLAKGYALTESPEEAGVILFNTCSVREHAEQRAVSNMGLLMKKYKGRIYGIIGCMAQALKDKLFLRLPGLDIVCGTGEIASLPELVLQAANGKVEATKNVNDSLPELNLEYREDIKHSYVSIMRGCNNFCSYCVVPYVRGRERSRDPDDIIREVELLVQKGITDITLLGQNVNSYRHDTGHRTRGTNREVYGFVDLLTDINRIGAVGSIKFVTSHPKDAKSELFRALRDLEKVVKHLHLPLQSGSDRILKLMNRGYTIKQYLRLVEEARKSVPGLRLSTDIIVGFPTERENDFNDTLTAMKSVKFDQAYIFKYSPRPGTKAAGLKDDVPVDTKKRRHKILLDLQKKKFE
ncbi:MAG: tRNA (N6-isopentenyl adenosine(37)-C2)-methylthiotransferase MiaB [Candidatus Omnitrophota bacterium]